MASLKEVNNELVRDLIEEFNKIKMDNNLTVTCLRSPAFFTPPIISYP